MKSKYELMLILDIVLSEELRLKLFDKIEKTVSGEGKITDKIDLGKKHLAYPINNKKEGNYWLLKIVMTGNEASTLTAKLKLDETIIRSLLIKLDKN